MKSLGGLVESGCNCTLGVVEDTAAVASAIVFIELGLGAFFAPLVRGMVYDFVVYSLCIYSLCIDCVVFSKRRDNSYM